MAVILFSRQESVAILTIHRPEAHNAMNLAMVQALDAALDRVEQDDTIHAVVVQGGGGKAFCAGGDIRATTQATLEHGAAFFRAEYRLNYRIATFPKPYSAVIDGIAMGGGLGVSVHGRTRIVTENALLAMPECAIGLFPDTGAAQFLTHKSFALGMWLALTGARLSAGDALYTKLATHFIPHDALAGLDFSAPLPVFDAPPSAIVEHRPAIEAAFSATSIEEIIQHLEAQQTAWAEAQLSALRNASPTSLQLTFDHMMESRGQDLKTILSRDYELACACLRGHDFREGVRALLLDKDKNPHWSVTPAPLDTRPVGASLF